jgi:type I restriction enzyme, S subunit
VRLPPYALYKTSSVEWLGEVPDHWERIRLGFEADLLVPMRDKPEDLSGPIPWIRIEDFTGRYLERSKSDQGVSMETVRAMHLKVFPVGTVLCSCSCSMGATAIARAELVSNQTFIGIVPTKQIVAEYLYYALGVAKGYLDSVATGAIQQYLSRSDFSQLRLVIPGIAEQEAISEFLDRETGRIDRLVAKKQELIERLKEKRIALISRTIRRGLPAAAARAAGLPANPPLKPSGIEWIGEIPKHWVVMKVKFVASMESGHTPSRSDPSNWIDDECVIPWVSLNDTKLLKENDFIGDTAVRISEEGMRNSSAHLLPAGVVVFTRDATIGLTAITTCPAAVSQHLIAWVPGSNITPKYLLLSFKAMQQDLESFTFGSTLKTIGMTDVRKLVTPVPPLPEQAAITAYLDSETAKLDALVQKVEEAVERLQEYRTALITAAVTGKIDVRKAPA